MNRILLLILIGAATFLILWLLNNPSSMEGVWLYLIGLSGVILKTGKLIFEKIKKLFNEDKQG